MRELIKLYLLRNSQSNVNGNLALKPTSKNLYTYEKPTAKKLVKIKPTRKVFMGCWQGCNEDNEGDGC